MPNASRDQNSVPTLIALDSSNGSTIIPVEANVSNSNALMVDDGTGGSDLGTPNAPRDQNNVPIAMAISSVDGVTPVVLYADSDGNLLINSN